MDIVNMSRLFAFQIVLLENLNGIEVRRIGQIGQIGGIGRISAGELMHLSLRHPYGTLRLGADSFRSLRFAP